MKCQDEVYCATKFLSSPSPHTRVTRGHALDFTICCSCTTAVLVTFVVCVFCIGYALVTFSLGLACDNCSMLVFAFLCCLRIMTLRCRRILRSPWPLRFCMSLHFYIFLKTVTRRNVIDSIVRRPFDDRVVTARSYGNRETSERNRRDS